MLTTDKLNEYCRKFGLEYFSYTDSHASFAHKATKLLERLIIDYELRVEHVVVHVPEVKKQRGRPRKNSGVHNEPGAQS